MPARGICMTTNRVDTVKVLVLYRKREEARRAHEHGVFVRFRYNDLKVTAGGCGGCGLLAMGIESLFACNLMIVHYLSNSVESENRASKRHDTAWRAKHSTRSVRRASGYVQVDQSEDCMVAGSGPMRLASGPKGSKVI